MSKKLDLEEFLKYYRKFLSIPTWTKVKHDFYDELIDFFNEVGSVKISSNYDSKTTKVKGVNHFKIFKVDDTQRGNMKIFRGQWVLMYCIKRHQTKFYLKVFPLDDNFDENQLTLLTKEFKITYDN